MNFTELKSATIRLYTALTGAVYNKTSDFLTTFENLYCEFSNRAVAIDFRRREVWEIVFKFLSKMVDDEPATAVKAESDPVEVSTVKIPKSIAKRVKLLFFAIFGIEWSEKVAREVLPSGLNWRQILDYLEDLEHYMTPITEPPTIADIERLPFNSIRQRTLALWRTLNTSDVSDTSIIDHLDLMYATRVEWTAAYQDIYLQWSVWVQDSDSAKQDARIDMTTIEVVNRMLDTPSEALGIASEMADKYDGSKPSSAQRLSRVMIREQAYSTTKNHRTHAQSLLAATYELDNPDAVLTGSKLRPLSELPKGCSRGIQLRVRGGNRSYPLGVVFPLLDVGGDCEHDRFYVSESLVPLIVGLSEEYLNRFLNTTQYCIYNDTESQMHIPMLGLVEFS